MDKLENDRIKYLAQISHTWKPQFGLNLQSRTLTQMQALLNNSPSWKRIIDAINTKVMPLYDDFKHFGTPHPNPVPHVVSPLAPASLHSPMAVTAPTVPPPVTANFNKGAVVPQGHSSFTNAGPTAPSIQQPLGQIPGHLLAHTSLQIKSEILA